MFEYKIRCIDGAEAPVQGMYVKIQIPEVGGWRGDTNEDGIWYHADEAQEGWNAHFFQNDDWEIELDPPQANPAPVAGPNGGPSVHTFRVVPR